MDISFNPLKTVFVERTTQNSKIMFDFVKIVFISHHNSFIFIKLKENINTIYFLVTQSKDTEV